MKKKFTLSRILVTVLICALTLYAPAELTRVIIDWDFSFHNGLLWEHIFEISFIWVLYIIGMALVYKVAK